MPASQNPGIFKETEEVCMRFSKLQLLRFGQPHAREASLLLRVFMKRFQEDLAATIKIKPIMLGEITWD